MIDLNMKPKHSNEEEDPALKALAVIGTLAFVALMWFVFTTAFINGIY